MLMIGILLFFSGAAAGSFLYCTAWRKARSISILKEKHSFCPKCKHRLYLTDLIPAISWLFLKGRCRYCKEKIPAASFFAEVTMGTLFLCVGLRSDNILDAIVGFCLTGLLGYASFYDIETRTVPNIISALIAALWLVLRIPKGFAEGFYDSMAGAVLVPGVIYLTAVVFEKVKKRESMGGGDIKLFSAVGLHLGLYANVVNVLLTCVLGLIYAALSRKRKEDAFALAPFISASTMIIRLFGEHFINI